MDSFEVENFRSLKHLKLEKLARVNLLVGKNNSGKTSVLESLLVLTSIERPYWPTILDGDRKMNDDEVDSSYLFYGFDGQKPIVITAAYASEDEKQPLFSIRILPSGFAKSTDESANRIRRSSNRRNSEIGFSISMKFSFDKTPVNFELVRSDSEEGGYEMNFHSKGSAKYLNNGWKFPAATRNHSTFLSTEINLRLLGLDLEELIVKKRVGPILNLLQRVDSRVSSISLGGNNNVYLDLGDSFRRLMPVELVGEGIQRLLMIASSIATVEGGFLFIDEIDNGLHYSVLRILWKGVLQVAREFDVQLVITTHSAEALRNLTWVLNEEDGKQYRDDVAAYTLIRSKDDTVRSFRYNYEQLEFAMEQDIEVRN